MLACERVTALILAPTMVADEVSMMPLLCKLEEWRECCRLIAGTATASNECIHARTHARMHAWANLCVCVRECVNERMREGVNRFL